jgi:hypothetical protein
MKAWNAIEWTPQMIAFLKENYQDYTNKQLADSLGLKLTSVRMKLYELGYKRMDLEYWSIEQIKFLKSKYKTIGDTELAEIFNSKWKKNKGWNKKHIEKKRKQLNLKRTKEEINAINNKNIKSGRFAICPIKMWDKRGRTPVGALKVWKHIDGRPLVVIKLKEGFVHYAPYLWKQLNGDIPEGMLVRLIDGNALNVVPENLKLVTRAEHAILNVKTKMQYPLEFRQAKSLLNQLNKKIKEHAKRKKPTNS